MPWSWPSCSLDPWPFGSFSWKSCGIITAYSHSSPGDGSPSAWESLSAAPRQHCPALLLAVLFTTVTKLVALNAFKRIFFSCIELALSFSSILGWKESMVTHSNTAKPSGHYFEQKKDPRVYIHSVWSQLQKGDKAKPSITLECRSPVSHSWVGDRETEQKEMASICAHSLGYMILICTLFNKGLK